MAGRRGVTQVVMEATGQQLDAGLAGAGGGRLGAQVGQRPLGQAPARRTTDLAAAAWLAELLEQGRLWGSLVARPRSASCGI